MKSPNVKAIYAYEPGGGNPDYAFPANELPPSLGSGPTLLNPNPVPLSDFLNLTKCHPDAVWRRAFRALKPLSAPTALAQPLPDGQGNGRGNQ